VDSETRRRRIRETIAAIPKGAVASYGQVAELAGIARGARLVAYVLRTLPAGHRLPWHRVLRSSGQIALPPGSTGFRTQRDRLRDEGVRVESGRVNMRTYRWQPDLDELIWAPPVDWEDV
jgi:methylated-DNA-protein-cysteine methyltransferase-like protein